VPVALAGMWFFVLILLLAGLGGRAKSPSRESVPGYIFALSTVALAFVLYLSWASYVQLKTFCVLCAMTYAAVIAVFIVSGSATTFPMTTLPRRAPRDLRALVSSPIALVLALLFVAGAGSLIAYFPREAPAAGPAPAAIVPLTDQQRADLEKWWVVQPTVDVAIPADGFRVTVVGFSDFQCPHCRSAHEAYRGVVAKYAGNGQVRFLAKHFPLEGECNMKAPNGSHLAACEAAAAVVMARATGKAAQMADWLYQNQATLTPASVREAARSVGGIEDFNARYAGALAEVKADASLGGQLGVSSTPTFFINSHRLPPGIIPPNYLDALIELELKRAR
jgi:protein-disulfide isomerase